MKQFFGFCSLAALILSGCSYHKTITVSAGEFDRKDAPVSVGLDEISSKAVLTETTGGKSEAVPSQIIIEHDGYSLHFILSGNTPAGTERTFRFSEGESDFPKSMTASDDGRAISLKSSGRDILTYNYALTSAPEGVTHLFDRSGYIHPAHSPSGMVLTAIQPEDHYHHYGIWNPWTRVEYDGNVYDLWNLGDSLGTVRAKDVKALYSGEVVAGFDATLEHFVFAPEGEVKILDELWKVRAVETPDGFLWDFTSVLQPCERVTIKAYRYQGFSIRATAEWKEDRTTMMSSEGLGRPDIDASTGRWIYVNGRGPNVESGVMFMSCPTNYNTPEPMRIWKNGDVFINFCPAKTKDWVLEPGQTYSLDYRVLTYDGRLTPDRAESLWTDFARPVTVTVR